MRAWIELIGREGRFWGTGGEYQRPAGGAAGLAGLRVYGATPIDGRLGLTIRPITGVYGGSFGPQDRGAFYQIMLKTGLFEKVAFINLPSREAARAWRRPISLLFIDGDHSFRRVKGDFDAWDPHVCLSGIIVFDDATDPAVGPANLIDQILASGRYAALETVGKVRFLRKVSSAGMFLSADKKRILVACHDLVLAGGLFRFERFGVLHRLAATNWPFCSLRNKTRPPGLSNSRSLVCKAPHERVGRDHRSWRGLSARDDPEIQSIGPTPVRLANATCA